MAGLFLVSIALPAALLAALLWRLFSLEAPQRRQADPPPSRPGLWYQSHRAHRRFPFQHLFIRITPFDPAWARRRPDLFLRRDAEGMPYCTLGAGPRDGRLVLEFNRGYDLGDPVSFEEPIPSSGVAEEDARVDALLAAFGAYTQDLDFAAWSRVSGRGYNCNSMVSSMARRSGMPLPGFARHGFLCPGLGIELPAKSFRSGRAGAAAPGDEGDGPDRGDGEVR